MVGSVIYFLYAIATVYDGFPSMVCQPFMAMGVSVVFVVMSFVVGLPLMFITPYRPNWLAIIVAGISLLLGLVLLCFPSTFEFLFQALFTYLNDAGISRNFMPVYVGYFIVIFTITN